MPFPRADLSKASSTFPFAIRSGKLFSFPMYASFYPLNTMKIKKESVLFAPLVSMIRRPTQSSRHHFCSWAGLKPRRVIATTSVWVKNNS